MYGRKVFPSSSKNKNGEFKQLNFPPASNGDTSVESTDHNVSYSTEEVTIIEYPKKKSLKSTTTDIKHVILTIVISLLAFPITYFLNQAFIKIDESERALFMSLIGLTCMTLIVLVVMLSSKVHDWLYYGFSLFAFTAVIDMIISLEYYGIIDGYMGQYLKLGETYLQSSWGNAITLFDAVGFFFMYLALNFQLANRKSWRSTSIYWGSGLLNSMLVFGIGIFSGSHSATACTLLNIPYIVFPLMVLIRAFQRQRPTAWVEFVQRKFSSTVYQLLALAVLLPSIWINLAKGLAIFGSTKNPVVFTVKEDKALQFNEPGPFAATQALVFFFYLIPLQFVSLYYLFKATKPRFLWDLTIMQAGAVIQGQFAYMVYSFDKELPEEIRVAHTNNVFWITNLLVLISPYILLLDLLRHKWATPLSAVERILRKSE